MQGPWDRKKLIRPKSQRKSPVLKPRVRDRVVGVTPGGGGGRGELEEGGTRSKLGSTS